MVSVDASKTSGVLWDVVSVLPAHPTQPTSSIVTHLYSKTNKPLLKFMSIAIVLYFQSKEMYTDFEIYFAS